MCGYSKNGIALCWAHIDPVLKNQEIKQWWSAGSNMSKIINRLTWGKNKTLNKQRRKELFHELRKCRVLCCNCHTIETVERGECNGVELRKKRKEMLNPTATLEKFFA